ncbi:leucine-rich repeat-containing protein 43 isoform X1 [Podarcis muralis]
MAGPGAASAAFWEHLRRLCLDQFPCGIGSWNKSRFPPRKATVSPRWALPKARASPRDGFLPPEEESVESLTDYLRSLGSPWALPADCSPEDQQLRELAVQAPRDIKDSLIFSYFKSLRIVNKNVTEIDADLLKFPNLEELILSANHISKINSSNLPPTLKVLELCGNEVDGLKDLCAHPPPELQHLGLGHNCQLGSSEEQYLTDTYWPKLVSLDLSYNNFTNLLSLLLKLLTMKKLRVLVLQGNPLALLPGYRGFVIDSLPKLCTLDDVIITPDERHDFLELSSNPELLKCYTKMVVDIGKVRGVPNPVGPEEPETGPEAPIITYNYYVTYEFAKDEKIEEKETDKCVLAVSTTLNVENTQGGVEGGGGNEPAPVDSSIKSPTEPGNVYSTPRKPWAEVIDCDHTKEHVTRDMVALKAYLLAGTTVTVVEEKVVSWPVVLTPNESPTRKGKDKGKAEKGKGKGKGKEKEKEKEKKAEKGKKDKGKEEKGKAKDAGKGGKKKKSPSPELRSDPPIVKVLGSGHVNLESLLAGEPLVETVCDFGILITESTSKPPSPKEKDSKKSAKKDKKAKAAAAESAASKKATTPVKGKGKKKDSPDGADIFQSQPVPLTVEFQMQHVKWNSASQILLHYNMSE